MALKVIVSSASLLTAKYGARMGEVGSAVDLLIKADRERGLDSRARPARRRRVVRR